MYTIEFQTKIKDGTIRVPRKYRHHLQERSGGEPVWVIIQVSGEQLAADYVDYLLTNPIEDETFAPLGRDETHERH